MFKTVEEWLDPMVVSRPQAVANLGAHSLSNKDLTSFLGQEISWHAVSGKLPTAQTTSPPLMCIKLTTASGCQKGLYQVSQNLFRRFRLVVTVAKLPVMLPAHVLFAGGLWKSSLLNSFSLEC